MPLSTTRRDPWFLLAVAGLFCAALVRMWHVDFGLPLVKDVDAFKFVDVAGEIVKTGNWRLIDPQYPGLYTYSLAIAYRVAGIDDDYQRHLLARLLAAAGGLGMVGAAGALASRLGGAVAVCVAIWLTAFSPECVTSSHVAATDTLVAGFMTLALAVSLAPRSTWKTWLLAGGLCGLAAGTKFSGAVVFPIVVLAALLAGVRRGGWRLAAGNTACVIPASAIAFWVTTPWILHDLPKYFERMRIEAAVQRYGQVGHVQADWSDYLISTVTVPEQPWLYTSILGNAGPLLLVLGLASVVLGLSGRAGRPALVTALYIMLYFIVISGPGRLKTARFLLPVLPAMYGLIGGQIAMLIDKIISRGHNATDRTEHPARSWITAVAVVVTLGGWPAYRSARYLTLLNEPSTNTLARDWVAEHVPPGAEMFVSPFYLDDLWTLKVQPTTLVDAWKQQYRLPAGVGPSAERDLIFQPEVVDIVAQRGMPLVLLNSYFDDSFAPTPDNQRFFPIAVQGYADFQKHLHALYEPVESIRGYSAGRFGPDVTIFRRRP